MDRSAWRKLLRKISPGMLSATVSLDFGNRHALVDKRNNIGPLERIQVKCTPGGRLLVPPHTTHAQE